MVKVWDEALDSSIKKRAIRIKLLEAHGQGKEVMRMKIRLQEAKRKKELKT